MLPTLAFLAITISAPACDARTDAPRCYVLLFGGQAERLQPQTAHTWATYVCVSPQAGGPARLESFTISWLPVSGKVRPRKLRPEPGRNFGLEETLDLMVTGNHKVSLWGPSEITPQ